MSVEEQDSVKGGPSLDYANSVIEAGPLSLDTSSLEVKGEPSHTVQMFKMACLSYNPSKVTYRQNFLARSKLMQMRKTLVDKCEEVINSNKWPHGS